MGSALSRLPRPPLFDPLAIASLAIAPLALAPLAIAPLATPPLLFQCELSNGAPHTAAPVAAAVHTAGSPLAATVARLLAHP